MKDASPNSLSVYSSLYHLVSDQLQEAQPEVTLPMTEATFLYTVTLPPREVDLSVVDRFTDSLTFIQTAYWSLLGRLPSDVELARWQSGKYQSEKALRRALLCSLLGGAEFSGRHVVVRHIPGYARVPLRSICLRFARRVYNHLPNGCRGVLRTGYHKCKELIRGR